MESKDRKFLLLAFFIIFLAVIFTAIPELKYRYFNILSVSGLNIGPGWPYEKVIRELGEPASRETLQIGLYDGYAYHYDGLVVYLAEQENARKEITKTVLYIDILSEKYRFGGIRRTIGVGSTKKEVEAILSGPFSGTRITKIIDMDFAYAIDNFRALEFTFDEYDTVIKIRYSNFP